MSWSGPKGPPGPIGKHDDWPFMSDFKNEIDVAMDFLSPFVGGEPLREELELLAAKVAANVANRLGGLWPLSIGSELRVPPGGSITVNARPQLRVTTEGIAARFMGLRLVIPDSARWFEISDIRVGKNSCLLTGTPLDARAFVELPEGLRFCNMKMPPAYDGMDISISARNIGPTKEKFGATVFGRIVGGEAQSTAEDCKDCRGEGHLKASSVGGVSPSAAIGADGLKLCYFCSQRPRLNGVLLCVECSKNDQES